MAGEVRALWFSDIEGSTRVLLRLGDDYEAVLNRHRQIVRAAFADHGGEERGTEGDSFFALFRTGRDAANAAITAQRALGAHPWPDGATVRIRIGLHLGEVQRHADGDLTGLALHVAARVMATAHGGQIVVTRALSDQLDKSIDTIDLGQHTLRDIPQPVNLHQVVAPGLQSVFPPLRVASPRREVRLPRFTTTFVGRDRQQRRAREALESSPLVSLVGPPGCGKTRLAVELAHRLSEQHELVSLVDLTAVEDGAGVGRAVALACGVETGGDPLDGTVAVLGDRPALLVVDNCEHVLAAAAHAMVRLTTACPRLRVLATSQAPLGTAGEVVVPVAGLDPEAENDLASRLFVDRAGALGVELTETDMGEVDVLVARLDRIPLAIELAASMAPTLSPGEMVSRLDDRFAWLVGESGDNPRHETLRRAVEWGFTFLGDDAQRVVTRLAVCSGTFDLDAAEALTRDLGLDGIVSVLNRLVRASWLVRSQGIEGSRYGMLESLRDFVRTRAEPDERDAGARAHAGHFLRLIEQGPFVDRAPREAADFARVDQDISNIVRAIRWAIEHRADLEAAAETYLGLLSYWQARPSWREPFELLQDLLEAATSIDPGRRAELLSTRAFYEMMVAGIDARSTIDEAGELAATSGSVRARLRWAHIASQVHGGRGRRDEALRLADLLIDEGLASGMRGFAQQGYFRRGSLRQDVEGVEACRQDLRRSLGVAGEAGSLPSVAFAHGVLATLALEEGDRAAAIDHAEQGVIAADRASHRVAAILCRFVRGRASEDRPGLRRLLTELVDAAAKLGTPSFQAMLRRHAALQALAAGDVDEAESQIALADDLDASTAWEACLVRASIARAAGRESEAVEGLLGALREAHETGSVGPAWIVLCVLAWWCDADEEVERVRAAATAAMGTFGVPAELEVIIGSRPAVGADTTSSLDLVDAMAIVERAARRTIAPLST